MFVTKIRDFTLRFALPFIYIRCSECPTDVMSKTDDNEFSELLPPIS